MDGNICEKIRLVGMGRLVGDSREGNYAVRRSRIVDK